MRFSQDYFEHTMDMEFLREYGYPFLKPQAEFYADYIVLNKNGGETAPFFAFETSRLKRLPRQVRDKTGSKSIIDRKRRVFCHAGTYDVPLACAQGRENTPLFAPFIYKSHLFTKTGSGQT
eukprot:COSAG06_NODE_1521_length_9206_cov_45.018667_6_plen_121_part_00